MVGDPRFLVAVAAGAAATVLVATRVGLPVSTTHAPVGGLAGSGLALAPSQLSWSALGGSYFLPLLVSPLLATAAAALVYPLVHHSRTALGIEVDTCLCIWPEAQPVVVTSDGALLHRATGVPLTLAEKAHCQQIYGGRLLGTTIQQLVDRIHVVSAFALGFARGLNDTPKVLALLAAAGWSGLDARISLAAVAGAMAAGGWLL